MKFPFRIRILPILLGIIILMISVRMGDVWVGLFDSNDGGNKNKFTAADLALATSGKALAQESTVESEIAEKNQENDQAPSLDGGPEELGDTTQPSGSVAPEGMAAANTSDEDDYFSSGNFGDMSPGEIRLLHDLVARREELNKRERIVKEREALLRSAEQQLIDKQAQLEEIKKSIEDLLKVYKEEQSDEARRLVKIYTNMKPKSAAQIFNEMDMDTLIQVFRGMKERSIASIMAAMNAEKARLITQELAKVDGLEDVEGILN